MERCSAYTKSTSGNSIVKEETFNAILRTITDGHTTEKGKWVAEQFLKYLHSGKNFFTKEEIQQSGGISNYEFRSIIRCYCDKGIIEKKEDERIVSGVLSGISIIVSFMLTTGR